MLLSVARCLGAAVVCGALLVAPASAKIEKFMNPCKEQTLCAFFRPSVTVPGGWIEDKAATRHFGAVILLAKGVNFNDSQATIYAVARFNPKKEPLTRFVAETVGELSGQAKDAKVTTLPDLPRAAGQSPFKRLSLEAPSLKEQGYELHAVTVDGDNDGNQFIVTITLSANSKAALAAAQNAYQAVLSQY
jgi:hypothetical protein